MAYEHYRLHDVAGVDSIFKLNEKVSCIDGTLKIIYIGTTHGRVLLLDLSEQKITHEVQLSTNAAVSQVIAATAFDYLIILSAYTIFNVESKTLKVIRSSTAANIAHMALNKNPVVADPYTLQLALATINSCVLICEDKMVNLEIKQKIRTENNVMALSYNKYCICYALCDAYFIHNIRENKTVSLFPYDPQIVHPIIVNADAEEFLMNGMQGLGVFATTDGVSLRPPLFWGTTTIISFTYRSPFVFVLSATSLTVFSCEHPSVLQRLPFVDGTLLECVDGRLYVCNSKNIYMLEEVSWNDRAKALVENEEFDEALQLAEKAISNGQYDEKEIMKFNRLRQEVAVALFQRKEYEKFHEQAILSELDPRKVLMSFEFLLPFPSNFESERILKVDFTVDKDVLHFLEQYLKKSRKLHWTAAYCRDLDAILLRLISQRKDILESEDIALNLQCTFDDCSSWMRKHKRQKFLVSIAFCLEDHANALAVCRELYNENNALDDQVIGLCVEHFPRFNSEQMLLEWVEFLLKIRHDDIIDDLKKCLFKVDQSNVIQILKYERSTLIKYLEDIKSLQNEEFHTMLFSMYVEEINTLLADCDDRNEKLSEYRKKLRRLILEPNKLDLSEIYAVFKRYRHFVVELTLLEGIQENGSLECLEKLLNEYSDYDAAELFCTYADTSEHVLHLTLLKYYLRNVKFKPELKQRVISLLNNFISVSQDLELLQEIPAEWSLSSVLSFTEGVVLSVEKHLHCLQLKKAVVERAMEALAVEALKSAFVHIRIDENTNCIMCGTSVGSEDAIFNANSNQILHRKCWKI